MVCDEDALFRYSSVELKNNKIYSFLFVLTSTYVTKYKYVYHILEVQRVSIFIFAFSKCGMYFLTARVCWFGEVS